MTASSAAPRDVRAVVEARQTREGDGFLVHRPFPARALEFIDPFLLLDEMGPADLGPGEAKGASDHPHRGFETVTYMIAGRMQHRDSRGNAGTLGPGDVQWMTAGAGVVHSELPEAAFARAGGRMHGFQLWVNLPRRDKMTAPRYQEIPSSRLPLVEADGGAVRVKVIAGESLGARAVIETRTPILYLHATLRPGGRLEQPVPPGFNLFAYVFAGQGRFGPEGRVVGRGRLVLYGPEGDAAALACAPDAPGPLEALLIGGRPLDEPVARYGPFVMNTDEEIHQAIDDYRAGRMGRIDP